MYSSLIKMVETIELQPDCWLLAAVKNPTDSNKWTVLTQRRGHDFPFVVRTWDAWMSKFSVEALFVLERNARKAFEKRAYGKRLLPTIVDTTKFESGDS